MPPEFQGGFEGLTEYLAKNIRYPDLARENNITGCVRVGFVVEKDGSVGEARLLKDIGCGCGEVAVRVEFVLPAVFDLQ